jgi:hypothetical protein
MADPRGISPQTQQANTSFEPPSPNIPTQPKDDDQRNTASLNMNTVADLKKLSGRSAPKPFPQPLIICLGKIPQNLIDGAQKAVRELNLPGRNADGTGVSAAEVFSSADPDMNPNRQQFNIPGYKGDWALSVDKKYIGNEQGQVSAEGWANVAKKLGQSAPLAAPAGPQ